jgi:CHAT domain-containing protein
MILQVKLISFLEIFLPSQEFGAMLNLADAHLQLRNLAEAHNWYGEARSWYESALNQIEEDPSNAQLLVNQVRSKQSDYSEVFYGLATVDLLLNDFESAQSNIEQALILNREYLPRVLSESRQGSVDLTLRYGYGIPDQGLISADFATPWNLSRTLDSQDTSPLKKSFQNRCNKIAGYTGCRQKYFELYVQLLMTQHQNSPSQGFDALALEMAEQARISDYESLQSRLSPTSSGQYLSQRRESLGVAKSFRDIQAEIPDDETLVLSYFLGEDSSYLWLISKNELQTYALPPRDEIEAQAREFYDLLTSPPGRVRPRTTAAAGELLRDMILDPVADQLGQRRLVIVGDGFLQYLPFGALPNPAPSATPSTAALEGEFAPALNPLMLEHEIVYLPSASALVGLRENRNSRPLPQQELAFFANPVFSHRDERVDSVRLAEGWEPFSPEELADVEVIYSQLPETERELEPVLASGLIPDTQVQKFSGYDASLEAALSPELGQHRIVHFASHGIFNSNAPDRSGVVLSGISETGVVQSGLLSPRHAFNQMDLSATDLVVLSGCRTGLSEGQMGREGVTGLTSGLMSAGADRVVASLWSVRDDATRELMQRFYARMLDPENPMAPAAALRAAQISMWEEARWQAPYYWAAFTLQGEWE